MAPKTLCPIRDIKGWHNYSKCPYTKSLFTKAGVSDVLHTSGRKERFFNALQKNVGPEGHLTKDAMKRTLGEMQHELDSNQFYKLCAAVLPEEKQRFLAGGNVSPAVSATKAESKVETGIGKNTQPDMKGLVPPGMKTNFQSVSKDGMPFSGQSPEAGTKTGIAAKQPPGLAANAYIAGLNRGRGNIPGETGGENKTSFFDAMRATIKNKQ